MNKREYNLLTMFIKKEILSSVDMGLRRAVKAMYKENIRLSNKLIELGGPRVKENFWGDDKPFSPVIHDQTCACDLCTALERKGKEL